MINLTKGAEPEILAANAARWTQELLTLIAAGGNASEYKDGKYNQPQIKGALMLETHEKCAYCESKVRHVTYGDIEHVIPKALHRELTFTWTNLTVACDVCNTNKGTREQLVDPYAPDAATRFRHAGSLVFGRLDDEVAINTEVGLQLNRLPLVERRSERLKFVRRSIAAAMRLAGEARETLLDEVRAYAESHEEFSANVRKTIADELESLGIDPNI